jgi:large subunit ribosomal protein L15
MKVHELQVESLKQNRRVGRGIGSGRGKTAGRGTKGQKARTGGNVRVGFAGGQNPLAKLLPKLRGFKALNNVSYNAVNLSQIERFDSGTVVDNATLAVFGLVKKADSRVKLLATGELTKKLTVKVQAASKAAIAAVEKAGGTVEITPLPRVHSKKATRPVMTDEAVEETKE